MAFVSAVRSLAQWLSGDLEQITQTNFTSGLPPVKHDILCLCTKELMSDIGGPCLASTLDLRIQQIKDKGRN